MATPLTPIYVPKARRDAWGEQLTESERWEVYNLTKAPSAEERDAGRPWLRDYHTEVRPYLTSRGWEVPGQSAWHRFLARMRKLERVKLIANVEGSSETAADMARVTVDWAKAAEAFKGLAVDAAMSGDDAACATYSRSAAAFRDLAYKQDELELKAKAQATKEEALRLAREKFEAAEKRLAAVQSTVEEAALTDEERIKKIKSIFGM